MNEFNNFDKPVNLNLITTYRCNFTCRHCISDCSPSRNEVMDISTAKKYIDETVAAVEVGNVGYTGGEPFLIYDTVLSLMDFTAGKYGIPGGMVTNCYWANDASVTNVKMNELYKSGLRSLVVSCDSFHLEFVPLENIKRVVHKALDLGITTNVNIVVSKNGSVSKNNITKLLSISLDDFKKGLTIKEFGPLLIGRAKSEITSEEIIDTDNQAFYNGICPFVVNTPSISPYGNIYACCCFGDDAYNGEDRIGYCGNAERDGIKNVFERMKQDLLFNLLANVGPYRVLEIIMDNFGQIRTRGRYLSTCDVCVELYHNHEVRKHLVDMLQMILSGGKVNG